MSLEIATENRIIEITPKGGWSPSEPLYVETPAIASKISGGMVLINQINWSIVGCTFAGHTHISGLSAKPIMATSKKVKCNGQLVLRKNDTGTCQGIFVNNSSGSSITCACDFKISDAGQTFVKGE